MLMGRGAGRRDERDLIAGTLDMLILRALARGPLHGYSVALGDIGNMLENIDPAEAIKNYQKELEIDQKVTQLSPDLRFRRSLAIFHGDNKRDQPAIRKVRKLQLSSRFVKHQMVGQFDIFEMRPE